MGILCKLFGHKTAGPGWWGDIPYVKIEGQVHDNIGRIHGTVSQTCDRCNTDFMVGRIHLNDPVILKALKS